MSHNHSHTAAMSEVKEEIGLSPKPVPEKTDGSDTEREDDVERLQRRLDKSVEEVFELRARVEALERLLAVHRAVGDSVDPVSLLVGQLVDAKQKLADTKLELERTRYDLNCTSKMLEQAEQSCKTQVAEMRATMMKGLFRAEQAHTAEKRSRFASELDESATAAPPAEQ